jgi:cell division protease FtsH
MKASTRRTIIIIAVVVLAILAIILAVSLTGPKEIAFSGTEQSLKALYEDGKIESLYISGAYKVKIKLVGESAYNYYAQIGGRSAFEDTLASWTAPQSPVMVVYDDPTSTSLWTSLVMPIVMLVALTLIFMWIMRKSAGANNQALNFGKTKANQVRDIKVRFNDVAGAEEEKQELREIVDFLKNPKKFLDIGARIPKGVLLVGPPGTGKTLFAKAVAGEASVPFFSISGSDFVEMFVGVGASRVRDLFEQAKRNMPCIIFIDEIDAVGRQRGAGLGGGNDEREQTLNQLLVQMDGFETNSSIIVMAATNRSDILDPALMRPGRFDRQIFVNVPDVRGREEIFKVHSRNKPLAPEVNFKSLARLTAGFTGADIENLLNESAILAARDDRKLISMKDISEAINKVIAGPAKKSRLVTESDKRITAYHESGHAIVAKLMKHCDNVHEVSIIPRGMAAGYTITLPENDDNHVTKGKLLDEIAMMLAGRAAEEIIIKDISTGASNDIQRASKIARKMVTEWGMSDEIGNMYLGASEEVFLGRDYQTQLSYSDAVAAKIDEEVKNILDAQYQVALNILKDNRSVMEKMVKLLYEKETIFEEEIDKLFAEDTGTEPKEKGDGMNNPTLEQASEEAPKPKRVRKSKAADSDSAEKE